MPTFSYFLGNEDATRALGEDLALSVKPGDCLALRGDLGAGKSALSRALIRAVAGDDELEVPSPTFTLVQSYELRYPIFHFDLYRLADESELAELGLDEALSRGVVLIEWPDKAGSSLPKDAISVEITHEGEGRRVTVTCEPGRFSDRLARVNAIRAFMDNNGYKGGRRRFLIGDSSFRAYERVKTADGRPLVLMDSAARPNGPPIRDGKPYSQLVHLAENVRPFIAIGKYLKGMGLSAPAIYETDIEQGILMIEDLGSEGVLDAMGKPIAERYEEAVRGLADMHRQQPPLRLPIGNGEYHNIPSFDRETLKFEAEVLLDWHIPWLRGGEKATAAEARDYLDIWDHLIDELDGLETNLVLRDYHSPNIMWMAARRGFDRVGIIDFQDAIIGPSSYDVVSLAQDARVTVERPLMERLIEIYMTAREAQGPFDRKAFFKSFAIMSAERACRLNGLWVRLWQRDGMESYMRHMPRTLWHLSMAFEHPVNAPLRDWCRKMGVPVRGGAASGSRLMEQPIRQAMVLAAGLGIRMRPITDTIPKPLVKIAGKPLIDYALDTLKAAGCEKAVVNVHWLAEQMETHLATYPGMEIVISDERAELLNSGGGLAKGLKLLDPGPVFVMNADLFWIGEAWDEPGNLERLAGFFDPATMDMAMLCVRLEDTTGHDGKIDFAMGGRGELVRYRPVDGKLPEGQGVVYAGAIVMNSRLLDDAPEGAFNLNIYFDRAIAAGRLYGLILDGHWVTAGTPEAIGDAEEAVRMYSAHSIS